MNTASDPVLEFLDRYDIAVPISVLDIELEVSRSSIDRAVPDLEARGLIAKNDQYSTHYEITDLGRAYLRGDVDAADLEPDDDN